MKRAILYITMIAICVVMLFGCGSQSDLVGVYQSDMGTIILYQDGSCQYMDEENAKWSVSGDTLTVTIQYPDRYYLDIQMDDSLSALNMKYKVAEFQTVAEVESCEFFESERMIRVKLSDPEDKKAVADAIVEMGSVVAVEEYTLEGGRSKHTLTVVDNCLIYELGSNDLIFVKVGN